mgnify:CR=1 FL=1
MLTSRFLMIRIVDREVNVRLEESPPDAGFKRTKSTVDPYVTG